MPAMSNEVMERVVATKEAAHEAAKQAYAHAQALLLNGAKLVIISTAEQEDDRSLQQNRYYWGPCLREISEQALVGGQRWTAEAWHELFKRQFLGYEIDKVHVAGRKRPTIIRRLRSTTKLKVKAMSTYLDQVQAFAATELGVQFSVRNWQEYQG
jgi:hypothetical protein